MEKVVDISRSFETCPVERLAVLTERYDKDERTGVKREVEKARKKLAAWNKEKERLWQMGSFERQYESCGLICGIDEAGRGPLAGPVVAGAVILPKDCQILYLNDSKKLTAGKREELYQAILEQAIAVGWGSVGPERIDEINILQATYEAMREAIAKLEVAPDILLNDAVMIPKVTIRQIPIIKGDAKSVSIAAASIVAKVTRDSVMEEYDKIFPEYGFAAHKGYGSATHLKALEKYGPSPIHRRSFLKNWEASVKKGGA